MSVGPITVGFSQKPIVMTQYYCRFLAKTNSEYLNISVGGSYHCRFLKFGSDEAGSDVQFCSSGGWHLSSIHPILEIHSFNQSIIIYTYVAGPVASPTFNSFAEPMQCMQYIHLCVLAPDYTHKSNLPTNEQSKASRHAQLLLYWWVLPCMPAGLQLLLPC